MIELPEAVTLGRQLDSALRGKRVAEIEAGATPHAFAWFAGDPAAYPRFLAGKVVDASTNHGGFVELSLGDARLLFAEGVVLRLLAPGEPRPRKHQLLVEFADGAALSASVQMYGGLWAYLEGTFDNAYLGAARRAPSPLSAGFDHAYFERLVAAPGVQTLSAKAFLATEQRVPGLGNGVLQDILYAARIHPRRKVATLAGAERAGLFDALKRTLAEMTLLGGRDTERTLFGRPGDYQTRCSRQTLGTPCRRCGCGIVKEQYLGGTVYSCPGCQPTA